MYVDTRIRFNRAAASRPRKTVGSIASCSGDKACSRGVGRDDNPIFPLAAIILHNKAQAIRNGEVGVTNWHIAEHEAVTDRRHFRVTSRREIRNVQGHKIVWVVEAIKLHRPRIGGSRLTSGPADPWR